MKTFMVSIEVHMTNDNKRKFFEFFEENPNIRVAYWRPINLKNLYGFIVSMDEVYKDKFTRFINKNFKKEDFKSISSCVA